MPTSCFGDDSRLIRFAWCLDSRLMPTFSSLWMRLSLATYWTIGTFVPLDGPSTRWLSSLWGQRHCGNAYASWWTTPSVHIATTPTSTTTHRLCRVNPRQEKKSKVS